MNSNDIPRPDRVHAGQPYWRVGSRLHTAGDGHETTLDIWHTFCAACGEPFTFACTQSSDRFEPSRRCEAHRRMGVKVGK